MIPAVVLFAAALHADQHPQPLAPLVGDALPPGAVARLGPQAFRYGGHVDVMHNGGPSVWYSADGKRLGVTSSAGVSVWDAATGRRLLTVPAHERTVTGLLGFDPAGGVLVDCRRKWDDGGSSVFRIDVATGKVTARFQPPDTRRFAAVSPDGKVVYSFTWGNAYATETVADEVDTGKQLWRRKHPEMSWMRVSPDGSRLVTWTSHAVWTAELLDAATGKTLHPFAHNSDYTPSWTGGGVAVGPKAEVVISAHAWNRGFSVFRAGSEKAAWQEEGFWHENAFVTGGGKRAVLVRERKAGFDVEVWDLAARKKESVANANVGRTLALSPDGKTLAAADYRHPPHTLHLFDVATGKKSPASPEPFVRAAVVWYLPDGTLASADEKLAEPVTWDVKTGAMTPLPAGAKPPAAAKPGPDFAPPAGTERVAVSPAGDRALGDRFDPDELDSVPGDTYLGLFDARGRVVAKFLRPDHTGGATYGFAPDGKTFAVARGDGTVTLFGSEDGKEHRVFRHGGGVGSLAFSPDGRFLATTCGDGPILVWNLAAGR
ncbi:MAG: hypothetical protein C0501_07425 [Isosphaera sp.]|nr:hypothetical protein [Isosphaera sp.]